MSKKKQIGLYLFVFVLIVGVSFGGLRYILGAKYLLLQMIGVLNIASFLLFGLDKSFSTQQGGPRLPEVFFYLLALMGAAVGIVVGAYVFRHKTRKPNFLIWQIFLLMLQLVGLGWWLWAV